MDSKIAQLISSGFIALGRKLDSLAMELRNKKEPKSTMNIGIPENVAEAIGSAMKEGLKGLKMPTPVINIPDMKAPIVNIPAVKAPIVNVEAPIVNVPPANITVESAPVSFPDTMKVEGMKELIEGVNRETEHPHLLDGISNKNPIPVQVVGTNGKPLGANDFGGGGGGPSTVAIRVGTTAVGQDNPMPVTVDGFAIPMFDTQVIDESAAPTTTTITYKRSNVVVATKVITISGTLTTISVTIS